MQAHLFLQGTPLSSLESSHKYIAKPLSEIAKGFLADFRGQKRARHDGYPMKQIRALAREIELLSPSIKSGGRRQDNCEYPWSLSSGEIAVPADDGFSGLSLLDGPAGKRLLRIINDKIKELLDEH